MKESTKNRQVMEIMRLIKINKLKNPEKKQEIKNKLVVDYFH